MSLTLHNDEDAYSALQLAAHDSSGVRSKPVALFVIVGLVIIICEAAIMAALHLLRATSNWNILLDPVLLAVPSTICLYWLYWFSDKKAYIAPRLAVHDSSCARPRPVALFIKVGLIIIICEAAIMAALHLLPVSGKWEIFLDPVLLAVLSTICLWWFSDKNAGTLRVAADNPSHVRLRPVILFIKVGLIIVICEAAIMAALHLLNVSSAWGILLDPSLLAVFGTIGLYRLIINPMNRMLEINEEAKGQLELFRGLLDKSNDAVFIIDPETAKLLDVNYRACITLGYTRAELLNMTALDVVDGSWTEQVRQVSSSNRYAFLQSRHKRKGGAAFPVEVNINLVKWSRRDYIIAVARDVTDREHAAIQLKESEAKFKKIAECANDAIITMGPKGEISFWNPAAERIFGYSRDEAVGKDLHTLLVPERFHDAFQKGFSSFQKTGKGDAIGKMLKLAAIRKNGSEFNIELSIAPVSLGGQWHAVGIIRDISERKGIDVAWANQGEVTVELTTG